MICFNFARKIFRVLIIFIFSSKAAVDNTRVILNEIFEGVTRIPGTKLFHEFSPIAQYSIKMKRTSEVKEPSYVHKLKNQRKQNFAFQVLVYVSCLYYNKRWVGIIADVDKEEEDVQAKFMHSSGPSRSFQWPHVDDIC